METQHSEIMTALRSLGASASAPKASQSRKREPDLGVSPLKALAASANDDHKASRGKGT